MIFLCLTLWGNIGLMIWFIGYEDYPDLALIFFNFII